MALIDMTSELTEKLPGMSRILAKKHINRAWKEVQDSRLWSFQLQRGGFATPAVTTAGSVSCTLGEDQIVGDAVASAAWLALPFMWRPTVQQFRARGYTIYSIIAMDDTDPNAVVLTLDRPFVDPLPQFYGVGYQMFGAYFTAPKGFKRWLNASDQFNMWAIDFWTSRREVDLVDPTRLIAYSPSMFLAMGADRRGQGTPNASATIGQQMFELYPTPMARISYSTWYVQEWPALDKNSDTLPDPIDEHVVIQKALSYAYLDAESRKDVMAAKGSGANYLALKREVDADWAARLKTLRLLDNDAVDSYMSGMNGIIQGYCRDAYTNTATGRASMGL